MKFTSAFCCDTRATAPASRRQIGHQGAQNHKTVLVPSTEPKSSWPPPTRSTSSDAAAGVVEAAIVGGAVVDSAVVGGAVVGGAVVVDDEMGGATSVSAAVVLETGVSDAAVFSSSADVAHPANTSAHPTTTRKSRPKLMDDTVWPNRPSNSHMDNLWNFNTIPPTRS